ncbi:3665_t:CDS:2, partial [Funneliformis geosporum]
FIKPSDYFDDITVEEWSYLNFLETFKPVIMSKLDVPKQEDKGTSAIISSLKQSRQFYTAKGWFRSLRVVTVGVITSQGWFRSLNPSSADTFWNHIEKEKEDLRVKREIVNKTNSVRNNTEIDALDLLDTARTEKTKEILSSLKRKHFSSDYTEEGYEEDENYSDDIGEDDENRMTQEKKERFRKIFQGIPTEAKLVLNSKTIVEDVLFEYAKDLDFESKEDWKELTKKPSLPSVDYEIGKELAKYMKEDLAELRQEVMCNFLKDKEFYDPKEHYLKEWIQVTLRHLCNLYENPSAPLHPRVSTDIKRTDAPSIASANRKNRARKPKQRNLTGRKIDGIIHHPTYNIELGALEAARSFVNDGDKKLLIESFKMPKTLKDILVDMIRSKRCNDEEVNKLVAIAIKFLKAIMRSQIIIENNLKALGFIEQKTPKDDFKEEDLISEILGNGQDLSRPKTPENTNSIVDCFETPHKKKNKPNKKTPRKMTNKIRRAK